MRVRNNKPGQGIVKRLHHSQALLLVGAWLATLLACNQLRPAETEEADAVIRVLEAAEAVRVQMRKATLSFLEEGAGLRGSSETFTFVEAHWVGDVFHVTYQGRHPDFFVSSHSRVVLSYDPLTGEIVQFPRG